MGSLTDLYRCIYRYVKKSQSVIETGRKLLQFDKQFQMEADIVKKMSKGYQKLQSVIQMKTFLSGNSKVCSTVNSQNMHSWTYTVVLLFTWLKSLTSCLLCKLYTLLFIPGSNILTHNVTSPVNASGKQDHYVYTRINAQQNI